MCGLQGSGKSTISARIAEKIGAVILRSDTIRKQLFNPQTYSMQENETVYEELLKRAQENLVQGENVVLDATFSLHEGRKRAFEIAQKTNAKHYLIYCACEDEAVVKQRLDARGKESESDARWPQYLNAKKSFEAPAPEEGALYIDTSSSSSDTRLREILSAIS